MARLLPDEELALIYDTLLPALSKAAIGQFDAEIEIDQANPRRLNELLMGVEVMLEVIREKNSELEATQAADGTIPPKAKLLDEVLHRRISS